MYSEEEYRRALEVYKETKSVTRTIAILGYPARRQTLGYSTASIYAWRRKYIQKGASALMNPPKERSRGKLTGGKPASSRELDELNAKIQDMQLEIDILKETIEVLKKDPGISRAPLKNREKAVIVDALKGKYPLPALQEKLKMAKSSYYYQRTRVSFSAKHEEDRRAIAAIFHDNKQRYGYRRIKMVLNRGGYILSEKIIRRIMRENGWRVKGKSEKKYCSYKGEISPEVPNLIQRDFKADKPNQKWLTDVTEFSIPAGKIYLSPMIDCYDGMPVAWSISRRPDAQLVNTMLDCAIRTLPQNAHPIVHSDRGCHYRWPGWIERMCRAGLVRSMSKKGCSPDNSACEGFFGRMKNEMFYGRSWQGVTLEEFIQQVNDYMIWYRDTRIKVSLGGMSPAEFRIKMGVTV